MRTQDNAMNNTTITTSSTERFISVSLYYLNPPSQTQTLNEFAIRFNNKEILPFICLNSESDKSFVEYSAPSNCMWCSVTDKYYENKGTGSLDINVSTI